jgi:hypothetical protein
MSVSRCKIGRIPDHGNQPVAEKSIFGIDRQAADRLDFGLANARVLHDLKTDFILAPHFSCIFADCAEDLRRYVRSLTDDGKFVPSLPLTIDVPKKQRMRAIGSRRALPNFVRPGGILYPHDRLLLQALADQAQTIIERKLDRRICFSHQSAPPEHPSRMFKSSRRCWNEMQKRLGSLSDKEHPIVLHADIASCFQNINQHTLVNSLEDCGYPAEYLKPLESMLTQASTSRSSRGILQGISPSDLFGNFYLYPIDRYLKDQGRPAVRYVDDIFVFFKSHEEAEKGVIDLYPELGRLDLSLNEAKSFITSPTTLLTSDPDLDALFQEAVAEIEEAHISEQEVLSGYGFQTIWRDEPEPLDQDEVELRATQHLFDQISRYAQSAEEIERFCLPLFALYGSGYALEHVLSKVESTPSMSQLYFAYLSEFLDDERVRERIGSILANRRLMFDWEYIWAVASVIRLPKAPDEVVANLLALAKERTHETVKALALIATAKLGDADRQKTVIAALGSHHSLHIQCAITFAARHMRPANRKIVLDLLENRDPLLKMVATSTKKKH